MSQLPAPRTVTTQAATGAAYDQGAQVVAWAPGAEPPVLWLSPRTELAEGTAIRGGIPVCFPWFGPGRTGDRSPSHGFARTSTWRPLDAPDGTLAFELTDADLDDEVRALWPYPFHARLTATFGATLRVELAMTSTGDEPVEVEAALHTYLSVGDVRQVQVRGLDGATYVDKTDGGAQRTQEGEVRFDGETDRVYAATGPVDVVDPVLGRTVHVSSEGATKTVVWNPGEEKATGMKDVDAWDTFCCVEAALALDGTVVLAPGETHVLAQEVAVASARVVPTSVGP